MTVLLLDMLAVGAGTLASILAYLQVEDSQMPAGVFWLALALTTLGAGAEANQLLRLTH